MFRCICHKYSASSDVDMSENVKPKNTKTMDQRERPGKWI